MRTHEQTGRVRAKRLPREVRERQILDAAVEVFSQRGYHSASMDEISEVADISKPMVYAYLGSKEDLFAACIRREATRLMEAIAEGVAEAGGTPDDQLWRGLRAFFGFVGEYRDSWRVLHRQASAQGGPFAQELMDMRRRAISLVAALLINTAEDEGVRHAATSATDALAAALVGASESLADWWLDHPEESAGAVAARLMNLVWMGFGNLVEGRAWQPPTKAS